MLEYSIPVIVSFVLSLALTPVVRRLAVRAGALDSPSWRKLHRVPLPRLGGVAVALSLGFASFLAVQLGDFLRLDFDLERGTTMTLLLGGALIFGVGVWDDLRPLSAWIKFGVQLAAAGVAIYCGLTVQWISLFGGPPLNLGWLSWPITALWIVGITNAFNLIDGLDGLAAGLACIAAATSATIFLLANSVSDGIFLLMLVGALAGFLRYNFNPATIFLGDSGSLLIGYILAVMAVNGSQKQALSLAVVIPLLVFGLPIIDTVFSMVRRFMGSMVLFRSDHGSLKERLQCLKRVFEADQGHIHHRLLARGFSHRSAVLTLYFLALSLSLLAFVSVLSQYRNVGIVLTIFGLSAYIGIHKLGYRELAFVRTGTLLRWCDQVAFDRRFFLGFIDLMLIAVAYWSACVLKYGFGWSPELQAWHANTFPLVLLVQMVFLGVFGLYRGVWRALGAGDVIQLGGGVACSVGLSYCVAVIAKPPDNSSVSYFFAIDLLLLGTLLIAARSSYRIVHYLNRRVEVNKGVLIYGAGHGGLHTLNELLHNDSLQMRPVGFIDDEPGLKGRTINGIPVVGSLGDLESILLTKDVSALIVSSRQIRTDRLRHAAEVCRTHQIPVLRCSLQMERVPSDVKDPVPALL